MHVSTDPKYWDAVGEKFFRKYSGIDATHKRWARETMAGRALQGPFGREWPITVHRDERSGTLKVPWTTLTNYPVQGTGADVMMLARVSFFRRLKVSGIKALIISTVHDSIYLDVPDDNDCQDLVNMFFQVFDDLIPNMKRCFGYDWVVPLNCECKIGPNMKNMEICNRTDK